MTAPVRDEVVVIDDDHGDLELVKVAFADAGAPLAVRTFDGGEAALAYLASAPKARRVVLLDLNMPGLDGRKVLERLRADEALRGLVVIVFTTSDSDNDVAACYAGHANAYVTKPSGLSQYRTVARRIADFWFETARLP